MELCLISCNIRFDNPADGQNSWQYRRGFLTETLLKHDPSIIATQEGRFNQLNELNSLLKNFKYIDQHRSWIKERMYPTFFIKKGMFSYLKSGDSWLSNTPDIAGSFSFGSAFPRLMTWSLLSHQKNDFLIINTHLDHVNPETRENQISVLVQEVEKVWDRNSYLIIMGDFNDNPESKVRESLTKKFPLCDAWKIFNSKEESSHHAFKGEIQNGSRIDWILTDERLSIKSCFMDKSDKNGLYPTDHFPIVCKIKL